MAATICVIFMAAAKNTWRLVPASPGVGFTVAIIQVIVPYAANLSHPERRGQLSEVSCSVFCLGSYWPDPQRARRRVAGLADDLLDSRAPMILVITLIHTGLPRGEPELKLS
jgi:hypothetical protein